VININTGRSFDLIWKAVMTLGLIHETNLIRTQVIETPEHENFKLLLDLIDLKYLPKDIGGCRNDEFPLTWPPNFPWIENYERKFDKNLLVKYNIKPFFWPCDSQNISKWFKLDVPNDYSQVFNKNSK
jgi:hypothetical protein